MCTTVLEKLLQGPFGPLLHPNPLPPHRPLPHIHSENSISVTKPFCQCWCSQRKWQMYCFQLHLDFSFNLILGRKHLLCFLPFVPHVYKVKLHMNIHWRLIFGNVLHCSTLQLWASYFIYFKFKPVTLK